MRWSNTPTSSATLDRNRDTTLPADTDDTLVSDTIPSLGQDNIRLPRDPLRAALPLRLPDTIVAGDLRDARDERPLNDLRTPSGKMLQDRL